MHILHPIPFKSISNVGPNDRWFVPRVIEMVKEKILQDENCKLELHKWDRSCSDRRPFKAGWYTPKKAVYLPECYLISIWLEKTILPIRWVKKGAVINWQSELSAPGHLIHLLLVLWDPDALQSRDVGRGVMNDGERASPFELEEPLLRAWREWTPLFDLRGSILSTWSSPMSSLYELLLNSTPSIWERNRVIFWSWRKYSHESSF